jgi:hypothetical protein
MSARQHEVAYAWATGLIEFGPEEPEGALEFARGPADRLRAAVEPIARHAYEGKSLLVPGVPEAADKMEAVDKLLLFQRRVWARLHPPKGRTA